MTSSKASPRISDCWRMSSSRRSPAPLMTTERRTAGMVSIALTSARMGCRVVDEVGPRLLDDRPVVAQRPGGGGGGNGVFDLEADAAVAGQRHVGQRHPVFLAAFAEDDGVALDINDALALGEVRGQHR